MSHRSYPAHLAALVYELYNTSEYTFGQLVDMHLLGGYVVSTPEYFILARPVDSIAPEDDILNPLYMFTSSDAWFIFLYAGNMTKAWDYFPLDKPYVGWQRRNRSIKFFEMSRIKRKVQHGIKP